MEIREGKIRTRLYIYVNLHVALIRDDDNTRFLMRNTAVYKILTFDIELQLLLMGILNVSSFIRM
jgi:hypothetical protein